MGHGFGSDGEIRWVAAPPGLLGAARAVLSLRSGGVSERPFGTLNLGHSAGDDLARVGENERRLAAALQLPGPPARARLEHGTRCIHVDAPGTYAPCDGLLTATSGLPLWLTVADCVPVFLTAGSDWIGLLHCGWRGTAAGAVQVMVDALAAASGVPPAGQSAWVGPGIGGCCYPVGADVAARFPREALSDVEGRIHLDLPFAITRALAAAGLARGNVDSAGLCTSCRGDLFFSYRRDGARSGRMAAVMWR